MCIISRVPVTPQCTALRSEYSLQTHVWLPQPGPSLGPVCQLAALRPIFTSFRLKQTPSLAKWRKMSVSRQRSVSCPVSTSRWRCRWNSRYPSLQHSRVSCENHWSVSPPQRHTPLCVPAWCPRLVVTSLMIIQHRGPNDECVWVW